MEMHWHMYCERNKHPRWKWIQALASCFIMLRDTSVFFIVAFGLLVSFRAKWWYMYSLNIGSSILVGRALFVSVVILSATCVFPLCSLRILYDRIPISGNQVWIAKLNNRQYCELELFLNDETTHVTTDPNLAQHHLKLFCSSKALL